MMNCNYFNEHIELLFDAQTPESSRNDLICHMQTCPACAENYRQTKSALCAATPCVEIYAPQELKERILAAAQEQTSRPAAKSRRNLLRLATSLGAATAIALVLLLINPMEHYKAHAAGKLFRQASATLTSSPTFYLEIEVRTLPHENFAYIDADMPYIQHRMWVVSGTKKKWRLEKANRIAVRNEQRTHIWNPDSQTGSILPPCNGAIENFRSLLDPSVLLMQEETAAATRKDVTYRKEVSPQAIILTVESPAQGDFSNNHLRNTSIGESNNRREYRFDRTTGELEAVTIDILRNGRWTTVARLRHINYDILAPDSLFSAPQGIEWNDLTQFTGGSHFAGINPEEAVRKLFEALHTWDEAVLKEGLVHYLLREIEHYAGSRLIDLQTAFRSGQYPGVFVPCAIVTRDGKRHCLRIALRNDNPAGSWVVDGGI